MDYWLLNGVFRFDAYPMPQTEDIIDKLGKEKYISNLDLTRGYWHIPTEGTSKEKTAFAAPFGLYQLKTMPFGLHVPPATFHRMMGNILQGTEDYSNTLLDDIVIFSNSQDEHLSHLREILECLRLAELTGKPEEMQFRHGPC